jgi:AcrR family transcriptional regulator
MVSRVLLETAIDQFGQLGFEGASTREIARISGTAMSSITYHFGGKEGLYLAAADHITECVTAIQGPALAAARTAGEASPEAATEALLLVLDSFAQMMIRPESEPWARFIMREQQYPTEAFERIYEGIMKSVVGTFLDLAARVRPDLDDRNIRAMSVLLFGQAMILRAGRASVCRILGVNEIDETAAALLRARLRANALCILSEKP